MCVHYLTGMNNKIQNQMKAVEEAYVDISNLELEYQKKRRERFQKLNVELAKLSALVSMLPEESK
jgi:hypothetical protein